MRFDTYDWNKSGYVNARENAYSIATEAIRKWNVWAKNLPYIEDHSTNVDDGDGRFDHPLNDAGNLYYIRADEYIAECDSKELPTTYPTDDILFEYQEHEDCERYIKLDSLKHISDLNGTTASSGDRAIGSSDILSVVETYQVVNGTSFKTYDSNRMSLEDTVDMFEEFYSYILDKACNVVQTRYYEILTTTYVVKDYRNQIYTETGSEKFTLNYSWCDDISQRVPNLSGKYFSFDGKSFVLINSTIPTIVHDTPLEYTYRPGEHDEPMDEDSYLRITALDAVVDRLALMHPELENSNPRDIKTVFGSYTMSTVFTTDKLLEATQVLIDYYKELSDKQDDEEAKAEDTPIGKLLSEFGYLRSLLESDISNTDYMKMSFRVQNTDNITYPEDLDKATNAMNWKLITEIPKWDRYFYAIVHKKPWYFEECNANDSINILTVPAYVINWDEFSRATPAIKMTILQATLQIDVGSPKPKSHTNVLAIVIAVVIIVVVSVATWGSATAPTTAAVWGAVMTIASSTLVIATELTSSNKEKSTYGKISTALAIIGAVASFVTILQSGFKIAMSQAVSYAFAAASYGNSRYKQQKLDRMSKELEVLTTEVDDVEELLANEYAEKLDRVKKFIYGEHITNKYTDYYNMYTDMYKVKKG